MNNDKNLMFAITREDPSLELHIAKLINANNILTVASGGCIPLELKYQIPSLNVSAFDFNDTQIEHCKNKIKAIQKSDLKLLNINCSDSNGLSQCGQFESMFRLLRFLFLEFLCDESDLEYFFSQNSDSSTRKKMVAGWMDNKDWETIFYQVFCDEFVHSIFDESATQNAAPDSYPKYFERVFSSGLMDPHSNNNPWLHHIFLGKYISSNCLSYLTSGQKLDVEFIHGQLTDVNDISKFQLVSLSNIFDWSDDSLVKGWADYLNGLESNSYITIRQLNNNRNVRKYFKNEFSEDKSIGLEFLKKDRSLFYNNFIVLRKK